MQEPKHSHNHKEYSSTDNCDVCGDASLDLDEADELSELEPQYLSKQSQRAFLASAGAVAALGTNYAMGFLRGSQEAKESHSRIFLWIVFLSRNEQKLAGFNFFEVNALVILVSK